MAADTFTSGGIGLLQMGTGNDNNSWGNNLNTSVIQILEDAISGTLINTVTGGTLDLSGSPPPTAPSQSRFAFLCFNGTLTSNMTVIVPLRTKIWSVQNYTSGPFSLFVQLAGNNSVQCPQGVATWVSYSGVGLLRRLDDNQVGKFEDFATPTVPAGHLECNGATLLIANYPDLFAAIGTTWGGNGVTTFNVPLLNDTGRFRRSRTGAVAVGTYQANQNAAHTHTGTATGTTDVQSNDHVHTVPAMTTGGQSVGHTHTYNLTDQSIGGLGGGGGNVAAATAQTGGHVSSGNSVDHTHNTPATNTGGVSANHTHTFTSASFTTSSSGGTEARPEAAVVLTCIRY